MTNKDAVILLKDMASMCEFKDEYGEFVDTDPYYEALDIAIEALEAQERQAIIAGSYLLEGKDVTNARSNDTVSKSEVCEILADIYPTDGEKVVAVKEVDKAYDAVLALPSAQPNEASCWGCNCPKMERLKLQKTFSEMVHLHDAETHDKRTETHSCDSISRQAAIDVIRAMQTYKIFAGDDMLLVDQAETMTKLMMLPSAKPEKGEWLPMFNGEFTGGAYWFSCSKCKRIVPEVRNGGWNFCPSCGSDMR